MKRFQLTIVFVLFSALTIGAGAAAVNSLTASSAERSLLRLTEAQSERDARFIATLVGQLLAEEAPDEIVNPPVIGAPSDAGQALAFNSLTLQVNAPTVLQALDISGIAIYDTLGDRIWTSNPLGLMMSRMDSESLSLTMNGDVVSWFVADQPRQNNSESALSDIVVTFVPLIGEQSGQPVQVLGVAREVPPGVTGLLAESRDTVLKTTLISLSGVFLILLAFILAADVRIWKRNEQALALERVQQEQLGRHNQELRAINESKSRFISAISHELSNPLASLVSFVDLVLRNRTGNLTDRQIEQLEIVRRNGTQMNRLVSDLSQASKGSVETLEIVHDEFEVKPLVDEIAESMSHDLNMRQQVLKIEFKGAQERMMGDRGRLVQVFSNLISNASKYSPAGSTVRLKVQVKNRIMHADVIDDGIGISDEDQEHMFEMFWRADNPDVEGTGIGLVLAKQIIEGHGGTISVDSALGEGTRMHFEVPMTVPDSLLADKANGGRGDRWQEAA